MLVQIALFAVYAVVLYATHASDWGVWRWGSVPLLTISAVLLMPALLSHGRKLTPLPEPNPQLGLIQHGVYAYVRHPIYLGLILLTVGLAILLQKGWGLAVSGVLALFFWLKAREEERRLLARYPEYAEYQQRTGRFLPRWHRR